MTPVCPDDRNRAAPQRRVVGRLPISGRMDEQPLGYAAPRVARRAVSATGQGCKAPDLALDLRRGRAPVDGRLALLQLARISDACQRPGGGA